jgi:carbon-monoxide dehydrogenase small subunit
MRIELNLNGKPLQAEVEPDTLLIDLVRKQGCYSVKRGCETSNCGACTVWMDEQPVLSCGVLAVRAAGHDIVTLEGMQGEAEEFAKFLAAQGADQCGFCNPGYVMNAMALFRENQNPTEQEIREYLAGNLCRCSGYESQIRGIQAYLAYKQGKGAAQ